MQRKYRRSLSAGASVPQATTRRSSMSHYQSWRTAAQGPLRNESSAPPFYHPYADPRSRPATPDRAETHVGALGLPPLFAPHYAAPISRSPYSSAHTLPHSSYGDSSPSTRYAPAKLPDIYTLFASNPSPTNIKLPPLQRSWSRSLSEPGISTTAISARSSPTPPLDGHMVKDRMKLDALLS